MTQHPLKTKTNSNTSMFSTGPNNPHQGTTPPAGSHNHRAKVNDNHLLLQLLPQKITSRGLDWARVYLKILVERKVVPGTNINSNNVKEIEIILPTSVVPRGKVY
ncbi:hypothetical protein L873DRAFT_682020 [Choiromyces venosus 120613-1]|uniref:Uncharacterized protein n=1 Tax=Choiromyces venosus 120613-1 TaxID=1336337 RepID=A0A3N4IYK2_9PEZI|nr:hypothetical protein L873DRAFT_682020 [Choiromyces venosus 120613-1]